MRCRQAPRTGGCRKSRPAPAPASVAGLPREEAENCKSWLPTRRARTERPHAVGCQSAVSLYMSLNAARHARIHRLTRRALQHATVWQGAVVMLSISPIRSGVVPTERYQCPDILHISIVCDQPTRRFLCRPPNVCVCDQPTRHNILSSQVRDSASSPVAPVWSFGHQDDTRSISLASDGALRASALAIPSPCVGAR